jgi:hypothetical protein
MNYVIYLFHRLIRIDNEGQKKKNKFVVFNLIFGNFD